MDERSKLLQVIDGLYASVLEESNWIAALGALGNYIQGHGTFYIVVEPTKGSALEAQSANIDPAIQADYIAHYSQLDVQIPPALTIPVGTLMTEYSLLAPGDFEKSQMYGELCEPWDIPHRVMMWLAKTPRMLAAVSIQRTKAQGRFLQNDFERYRPLVPHLLRAFRLRELLRSHHAANQGYFEVLDRLPFGIALLDGSGRVIELTQRTRSLVQAGQSIGYKHGRIFALHPADDRKLQRAISHTLRSAIDGLIPGDTIMVRKLDGNRPLNVVVMPVRHGQLSLATTPTCIIVFFDPDYSPRTMVSIVKATLRLTEAEALLACLLFTGITLREAAERLNLSINTCKSQLKSVYAKTGCRSQVDLAKLLLTSGIVGR